MNAPLAFLTLYGTALVPIVLAWIWARHTMVPTVRRFLRVSALAMAVLFFVIFGASQIVSGTCGGNILYGYTGCSLTSDWLANKITAVTFISILCGIAYVLFALVLCAFLEIRYRRAV